MKEEFVLHDIFGGVLLAKNGLLNYKIILLENVLVYKV